MVSSPGLWALLRYQSAAGAGRKEVASSFTPRSFLACVLNVLLQILNQVGGGRGLDAFAFCMHTIPTS